MIHRHRLLAAAIATVAAGTPAAAQRSIPDDSPAAALALRVDSLFSSRVRPDGPGCAVGVYRNGSTMLTRGYGVASVEDGRPITPRTTFTLGSASKPFTALAALMLEQQGKLSLDDDVRRWVPELPDHGTRIRVRDLLQHTSGLRDYGALNVLMGRNVATMRELLGLLAAQQELNFAPGSRHEYSHSDYELLGLVIERVVGVPFGQHLERAVLEPMGMRGSFVNDDRRQVMSERAFGHVEGVGGVRVQFPEARIVGGSNVYASVEDLVHWHRNFDTPVVGDAALMARIVGRPQLASGDTIPYAYGLRLGSYRGLRTVYRVGHDHGMLAAIIRFPDQHFTVAMLCNSDDHDSWRLAQEVADLYLGDLMQPGRPRPTAPAAVTLSPRELARYAGVYRLPDHPWMLLPIELRNGALGEVLFHDVHDDTLFTMTPAGGGRFFEIGRTGNLGMFTFRPASPGVPPRLDLSWNDEPAESLDRVPDSALWRPSAAALAEYAGMWFSQEIDAGWLLEQRGERLVLRRPGHSDLTLWPVEQDVFVRGFGSFESPLMARLHFHRDDAGRLTRMSLSTPPGEDSVQNLRFVRVIP